MTLPDVFVLSLSVGFLLSLLSLFSGIVHVPHVHLHFHSPSLAHLGTRSGAVFNIGTLAAFLIWFGGAGYLLTRFAGWRLVLVLAGAGVSGLAGAAVVFWFLAKVILANERALDAADYEMTGMLGRLTDAVREGGTGEMIFSQQGRRCGVPVRTESGEPLAGGTEVVVTRYENGIAYVKTWDEFQKL